MVRNDETRFREFPSAFQIDPSWYERYWLQQPAPRKPGLVAFFRRIISQQRLTGRQDLAASNNAPSIAGVRKWFTDAGRATAAMLSDYRQ